MEIIYKKKENGSIIQVNEDVDPKAWSNELDWVDIRIKSRKELADYFHKLDFLKEGLDCLKRPEEHPFLSSFGNIIVLNLSISNATDIYKTDYISVIVENKLIITVTPQISDVFNESDFSSYSEKRYPSLRNYLFYILAVKSIAQANANMSLAKNRLHGIELMFTKNVEKLSSNAVMSCERDINQLSNIIEDQYVGFELLDSMSTANLQQKDTKHIGKIIKGFDPMNKAMIRLEKKAESVRLQYMLLQQEKSTRKINVLTIIQAIFVPLTFIAGVYGMNFINIPELNWPHGYFLVWILFVVMAIGLLRYFYRKGWFD